MTNAEKAEEIRQNIATYWKRGLITTKEVVSELVRLCREYPV